jgi:coenzyme F420 hydrogenase subunit beta
MFGRIKNIKDVVDWGLCVGCGLCYDVCDKDAIELKNIKSKGIRPIVDNSKCSTECRCLSVCPGYSVDAALVENIPRNGDESELIFGPVLEIWEGYASDPDIRYAASSGGAVSALALYCLEKENMDFALHAGINPKNPLENVTVASKSREELLSHTGSRYAPASPCDSLSLIEDSEGQCVFIGKPCDTAAVTMARKQNAQLDSKLGLVLTFFCAGAPSTNGTIEVIKGMDIETDDVNYLRYRGNSWPGSFTVSFDQGKREKSISYMDSWGELQKYRQFRCYLCPDGLGQIADISCGDAWHTYKEGNNDPGNSLILVRTERGRQILHDAQESGYLELNPSNSAAVIAAQGLIYRKPEIFGRLLSMRMFFIPIPLYNGFSLFKSWMNLSFSLKIRSILSTVKRILLRGLWRRHTLKKVEIF